MSAEKGIKDTLSQLKTQFSTSPPKAHIIGISGAGGNGAQYLANHTDPGTHEHMSMTFLDTDRENIALRLKKAEEEGNKCFLKWIESGRCSFLLIGEEITKGRGAGGDPEQGARAVEASKEAIMEHIGDADLVLSITGLGGGTGTKGSAVIAKLAKEAGKESFVVGIKPFVVEENRLDYADEGEDSLLESTPSLFIYNENFWKYLSNDDEEETERITHADAYKEINRLGVYPVISFLKQLFLIVGLTNIDVNDFKEFCKSGRRMYLGHSTLKKEGGELKTMEEVFETLTNNPFQSSDELKDGVSYMLGLTGPDWAMQDEHSLREKIQAFFDRQNTTPLPSTNSKEEVGESNEDSPVERKLKTWQGIFPDEEESQAFLFVAIATGKEGNDVASSTSTVKSLTQEESQESIQIPNDPVPAEGRTKIIRVPMGKGRIDTSLYVTPETAKLFEPLSSVNLSIFNTSDRQEALDRATIIIEKIRKETAKDVQLPANFLTESSLATTNGHGS